MDTDLLYTLKSIFVGTRIFGEDTCEKWEGTEDCLESVSNVNDCRPWVVGGLKCESWNGNLLTW